MCIILLNKILLRHQISSLFFSFIEEDVKEIKQKVTFLFIRGNIDRPSFSRKIIPKERKSTGNKVAAAEITNQPMGQTFITLDKHKRINHIIDSLLNILCADIKMKAGIKEMKREKNVLLYIVKVKTAT